MLARLRQYRSLSRLA